MNIDRWCLGWTRPPHVPDGALIATNLEQGVRLCRPCWLAWSATDAGVAPERSGPNDPERYAGRAGDAAPSGSTEPNARVSPVSPLSPVPDERDMGDRRDRGVHDLNWWEARARREGGAA